LHGLGLAMTAATDGCDWDHKEMYLRASALFCSFDPATDSFRREESLVASVPAPCLLGLMWRRGQTQQPDIEHASRPPASGREMFMTQCVPSHGLMARVAGCLLWHSRARPLSKRNGRCQVPALPRYSWKTSLPAHGSREIPVWNVVRAKAPRSTPKMKHRIANWTQYVETSSGSVCCPPP
jgi:hypothetical protein